MEAIISAAETGFTGSLVGSSIPWNQNDRARRYKAAGAAGHMTTTTASGCLHTLKGTVHPSLLACLRPQIYSQSNDPRGGGASMFLMKKNHLIT